MKEIIKKVNQSDEATKRVLLGLLKKEIAENTTEFEPSIETIELPRQYGKTAMAIGYAITRVEECNDNVCIVSWSFQSACNVVGRVENLIDGKGLLVGKYIPHGSGNICVLTPLYSSLVGNNFDVVIFDESWNRFKQDAKESTTLTGNDILLGVVKPTGRVIRFETSNEKESSVKI